LPKDQGTDNVPTIQSEKYAKASNHTARMARTVASANAITLDDPESDSEADDPLVTCSSTNHGSVSIHLSKYPRVSLLGTDTMDASRQATFYDLECKGNGWPNA
jgi:hypothetical protein